MRSRFGAIYELSDGREVYLAWRETFEIYRSGLPSLSDAVATGVACWAIDEDTLIRMRIDGVQIIGVLNLATGDIYIAHREHFYDPAKNGGIDYSRRGGAVQRLLPLKHFAVHLGTTKIK